MRGIRENRAGREQPSQDFGPNTARVMSLTRNFRGDFFLFPDSTWDPGMGCRNSPWLPAGIWESEDCFKCLWFRGSLPVLKDWNEPPTPGWNHFRREEKQTWKVSPSPFGCFPSFPARWRWDLVESPWVFVLLVFFLCKYFNSSIFYLYDCI